MVIIELSVGFGQKQNKSAVYYSQQVLQAAHFWQVQFGGYFFKYSNCKKKKTEALPDYVSEESRTCA